MTSTTRVLPHTPWAASSLWSFRPLPLAVLVLSLSLFGVAEAMLVRANLGATPWVVFAQGIGLQAGISIGWATFYISIAVLLLWIPLRLRPGAGTLLNMLLIALVLDIAVRLLPAPAGVLPRIALCLGGILIMGLAAALYLTCHLGAGPRDGLMVGLCRATGWRIGAVRTLLESAVCLSGWLLGGTLGIGTVLFAFGVGWVIQLVMSCLERRFAQP